MLLLVIIHPIYVSVVFQLVAGSLPLDFTNTLDNRGMGPEREQELLSTYADLTAFLRQSNAISDALARKLNARAAREPRVAAAIVTKAQALREAMYRVIEAIAENREPAPADLKSVNDAVANSASRSHLQRSGENFAWTWSGEPDALERALWPIIRATADLLTSENLSRIRLCEADTCRWAFLDTSRNRSRRWCDMKVCGNRAKARRFYERQRHTD
jgi:predicted RNA-binding Zn ribbon-like protein